MYQFFFVECSSSPMPNTSKLLDLNMEECSATIGITLPFNSVYSKTSCRKKSQKIRYERERGSEGERLETREREE